jgi:membrane associated rhomboid family serine protease
MSEVPPYLMPFVILDVILSLILLLPISDSRRQQRLPIVTLILVGINTGVFIYFGYLLPRQVDEMSALLFTRFQMMTPAFVMEGVGVPAWSMISSAFMHGSWSHLLGNMFFLLFFGRRVEDLLGPAKFLLLYLVCVYVSGLGSVIGEVALPVWQGIVPNLGASGAIMGVVGAYLFLYYEERIRTLPMIFGVIPFIFYLPRFPVWVFILYTILRDVLNGWLEEQFQAAGSYYSFVNSFAHLSGIIAGMVCIYLFLPPAMLHFRRRPGPSRSNRG